MADLVTRTLPLLGGHALAPRGRPRTMIGRLLALAALRRSRRQLARLEAHLLRDVGLTGEEARREARAPVWNAPEHWLR